jgi:RNA polymerase sigma-70 factor (ECF subfamily)
MVMSTVTDKSAGCGVVQREEAILKSTPEVNLTELPDGGSPTLRTLFDSEESNLLRFAFSLTGRRAVAEEIVQEVFLQLHAKWSEVNEPRAWLFRCVRNRAFHYLRKSRRETLVNDEGTSIADNSDDTPDELLARMETVAQLRELVSRLPEKDRKLVQLKYYEDLKYRDISQRTGLTITNVGYRLHQVLKKLAAGLLASGAKKTSEAKKASGIELPSGVEDES